MAISNSIGSCGSCTNVIQRGGTNPCTCLEGSGGIQASSCNCSNDSTRQYVCSTCASIGTGCSTCISKGTGCKTCTSAVDIVAPDTPELYYLNTSNSGSYPVATTAAGISSYFGSTTSDSITPNDGLFHIVEYGSAYYGVNAPLFDYSYEWYTAAYNANGTQYYAFDFSKYKPSIGWYVSSGAKVKVGHINVAGDAESFLKSHTFGVELYIMYNGNIAHTYSDIISAGGNVVYIIISNNYYYQENLNASMESGYSARARLYNVDLGYSAYSNYLY